MVCVLHARHSTAEGKRCSFKSVAVPYRSRKHTSEQKARKKDTLEGRALFDVSIRNSSSTRSAQARKELENKICICQLTSVQNENHIATSSGHTGKQNAAIFVYCKVNENRREGWRVGRGLQSEANISSPFSWFISAKKSSWSVVFVAGIIGPNPPVIFFF